MNTERFRGRKWKGIDDVIYHNKDLKYIVKQNKMNPRKENYLKNIIIS